MKIEMKSQFRLIINADEFRLISKSLRGATLDLDEQAAALALQERMIRQRAEVIRQNHLEAQKHVENIDGEEKER